MIPNSSYATIVRQSMGTVVNNAGATSITLNPTGPLTNNDLLVAFIYNRAVSSGNTISTPAGWTKLGQVGNAGTAGSMAMYYKKWTTGDTEGATFSWTDSVQNVGVIVRYSGQDTTTPSDVAASTNSATSGTTATSTGITTTLNNAMLVFATVANSGTATFSAETSPIVEIGDFDTNQSSVAGDGLQASAGASGDKTATISLDRAWAAMLWAIRPNLSPEIPTYVYYFNWSLGTPAVVYDATASCSGTAVVRFDWVLGQPAEVFDSTATCAAAGGTSNTPKVILQTQIILQGQMIIQ